jgi:ribosomal protein S18 acetylase RimI-like enzyme
MIAVSIRQYKDDDFPLVLGLETAGGHEPYRSAVFIRQMGVVCRNTFLVALLDTEQVGYTVGVLVQGQPREAWILRIGVHEDQRRNGVGSILLSELLEVFCTLGVRTVRLTVSPWNVPALGLYLKSGFKQENYHEAYFGRDEDRIVMVKDMG